MNLPRPVTLYKPSNGTYLNIKGLQQGNDYSCGFTAALMVVNFFNSAYGARDVLKAVKTDTHGTSHRGLITGLRSLGIKASTKYSLKFMEYKRCIDSRKPVITYDHDRDHWELLYGYVGDSILLVADPDRVWEDRREWKEWKDSLNGYGIVCSQ